MGWIAGATLAAILAVGAALGLALWHGPATAPAAPVRARDAPAPARLPAGTPPPLPLAAMALAANDHVAGAVTAPQPRRSAGRAAVRPPAARATSHCGARPDRGGRSGCPDPALAALDQQVNEAFAGAIRSGAAAGPLGQDQENWIIRRDRVRREHPELAPDLYRARIAQLQAVSASTAPN